MKQSSFQAQPSGRATRNLERVLARIAPSSTEATRLALVNTARIREFARGDVIVAQGERSTLGLVVDGFVAARRTTPDGRVSVPLILGGGEVIASMSIAARATMFDFVALVPGSAAFWSGSAVRSLAAEDAGLALDLLGTTLRSAGALAARLDTLHYQDARKRVARVLVQYRDLCFGEQPPIARAELSWLVGTSREMTGRVLGRLEADGAIVRIGRGGLELRDADRLHELAGLG